MRAEITYKSCVICGSTITIKGAINKDRKCCGPSCGRKLSWINGKRKVAELNIKKCLQCGNEFKRKKSSDAVTYVKHCSRKCYSLSRKKEGTYSKVKCANCNTEFTRRTDKIKEKSFCSPKCSSEYRSKPDALWKNKDYIKKYHKNYSHIHRVNNHKIKNKIVSDDYEKITSIELEQILIDNNYTCIKCGSKKNINVDHIVPICMGGKHIKSNIQVLCKKCNSSKGIKTIKY